MSGGVGNSKQYYSTSIRCIRRKKSRDEFIQKIQSQERSCGKFSKFDTYNFWGTWEQVKAAGLPYILEFDGEVRLEILFMTSFMTGITLILMLRFLILLNLLMLSLLIHLMPSLLPKIIER